MKIKRIGLLCTAVCVLAASAYGYRVEKGDTLYKIAREHGTTVAKLAQLNGINENSVLKAGQELKLASDEGTASGVRGKVVDRSASAALSSVYTVKSGDTLYGVAKKTGTTVREIVAANSGFSEKTMLKAGQIINLPAGSSYTKPDVRFAKKPESAGRTDMVGLALSLVGTRYVSGGTSRGGFDCSGLTSYVYAQYGIKLPRTAREQAVFGKAVNKSDLKKGDLVLFSIHRSGVDHVGMYVGSGSFVHAANSKRGVRVDKLSSDYYASRYVGARRAE